LEKKRKGNQTEDGCINEDLQTLKKGIASRSVCEGSLKGKGKAVHHQRRGGGCCRGEEKKKDSNSVSTRKREKADERARPKEVAAVSKKKTGNGRDRRFKRREEGVAFFVITPRFCY